jgi:hypothetical protein
MFWLHRANTRPVAPTLEQFSSESRMPELLKEKEKLYGFLFARPAETGTRKPQSRWSGKSFYRIVAQARRARLRRTIGSRRLKRETLCLNPEGGK